jgi:hypothetical protein
MNRKFIDIAEWHTRLKRGDAMGDVALAHDAVGFQLSAATKEVGGPPIPCVMSNPDVDLAGDSIKSWDLGVNVPLLWSHQADRPPLGKLIGSKWANQQLTANLSFMSASLSSFAAAIEAMVRKGYIRSGSVGFIPVRVKASNDPARPFGYDILLARLLEFSIVNVPCLPSAVIGASATSQRPGSPPASTPAQLLAEARAVVAGIARRDRIDEARAIRREIELDEKNPAATARQARLAEARRIRREIEGR